MKAPMPLRVHRAVANLTQKELAKRAGLSSASIVSDVENGTGNPTLRSIHRIARALGVDINEIKIDIRDAA